MIEFNLSSECLFNKSRSDKSQDQRVQHDEVGRLCFHPQFSVSHLIIFLLVLDFYLFFFNI